MAHQRIKRAEIRFAGNEQLPLLRRACASRLLSCVRTWTAPVRRSRRIGCCWGYPAHVLPAACVADGYPRKEKVHRHGPQRLGAAFPDAEIPASLGTDAQETYDFKRIVVLVETSMLASISGMVTLLLTLLKLESYLFYLLPFPLVLSTLRSGPAASRKTLMATFFLILVLLGPARAFCYVLLYGLTGITLGQLWTWRMPWVVTIPCCVVIFLVGLLGFVVSGSWLLQTNFFMLLINNVYGSVAQLCTLLGLQATPSIPAVVAFLFFLAGMRGLFYITVLHVLYAFLLSNMGYKIGPVPRTVAKLFSPTAK